MFSADYVYIVQSNVESGGCESDTRGSKSARVCIPELDDKVFYMQRYVQRY